MGQFSDLRRKLAELLHIGRAYVSSAIRDYRLGFELRVLAKSNDDAADIPGKPMARALRDV